MPQGPQARTLPRNGQSSPRMDATMLMQLATCSSRIVRNVYAIIINCK